MITHSQWWRVIITSDSLVISYIYAICHHSVIVINHLAPIQSFTMQNYCCFLKIWNRHRLNRLLACLVHILMHIYRDSNIIMTFDNVDILRGQNGNLGTVGTEMNAWICSAGKLTLDLDLRTHYCFSPMHWNMHSYNAINVLHTTNGDWCW